MNGGARDTMAMYKQLVKLQQTYAQKQEYKMARQIQIQIQNYIKQNPGLESYLQKQQKLEACLEEENFKEAQLLQSQLQQLSLEYREQPITYTDQVTDGVRVQVLSIFVPERTNPSESQYWFKYNVSITNETMHSIQIIESCIRYETEVDAGTIESQGLQQEYPIIPPSKCYSFTRQFPIKSPTGAIYGWYKAVNVDGFLKQVGDVMTIAIGYTQFVCDR